MKHYLDENGRIYAYESDGSNDHHIPKHFKLISNEEAKKLIEKNTKKLIEEAEKQYNQKSSVEKLTDFLRSNPEVAELLNK